MTKELHSCRIDFAYHENGGQTTKGKFMAIGDAREYTAPSYPVCSPKGFRVRSRSAGLKIDWHTTSSNSVCDEVKYEHRDESQAASSAQSGVKPSILCQQILANARAMSAEAHLGEFDPATSNQRRLPQNSQKSSKTAVKMPVCFQPLHTLH